MAGESWQISGDYFETCSCDYLCPCIITNLAGEPTKGECIFAMVYHIDHGAYGSLTLDGLNFAIIGHTPEAMGKGNLAVGVVVDATASVEQQQALAAIASGQAGGPMANLGPLVGEFRGVEARPIHFQQDGLRWSVSIPNVLDQAMEGTPSAGNPAEPLYIDNTLHPAKARLALGRAVRSHLKAFGLAWDDTSGRNNGHFAPFTWRAA
jgi:hypothetical protein